MLCDPIEVACDLPRIRRAIRRRHADFEHDTLEDLVSRAALELVERARRNPGARHPRSRLMRYARLSALAGEFGELRRKRPAVVRRDFDADPLAVPSFVAQAEWLAERMSEEATEEQEAEWRSLTVRERGERIAEACRLTATSIGPTSKPWRGM